MTLRGCDDVSAQEVVASDFFLKPCWLMMTRRRAHEILEVFVASLREMNRDEMMQRWALPEEGGPGVTEAVELRDELSAHFYMRTVTATLLQNGSIVVGVGVLPPESAYRCDTRWLPRIFHVARSIGLRWLLPVAKTVILRPEPRN